MHAQKILCAAAGAAALVLLSAVPAAADIADPRSSCGGLALSDHAVNDGPGAISVIINEELKPAAEDSGFANAGQVVRRFAQVHAGTHVPGCENAFFDILITGP